MPSFIELGSICLHPGDTPFPYSFSFSLVPQSGYYAKVSIPFTLKFRDSYPFDPPSLKTSIQVK